MDPITLLALSVALNIPTDNPGNMRLDISPQFAVPVDMPFSGSSGMTLPGITFYDSRRSSLADVPVTQSIATGPDSPDWVHHEMNHVRQQDALGPLFWLAYALSGGNEFEPYNTATKQLKPGGWDSAWTPPPDNSMRGNFPMFRVNLNNGDPNLQFMPGYADLFTPRSP